MLSLSKLYQSKQWLLSLTFIVTALLALQARAVEITYEQVSQVGNHYEYSYSVFNNSGFDVEEFSLYFEPGSYENLEVLASPLDWDPVVVQPDFIFDGFVDWLALGDVLTSGSALAGFTLAFDWLGSAGSPLQNQLFEVLDPVSFNVLETGLAREFGAPVAAAEPGLLWLILAGLIVLFGVRQRSAGTNTNVGNVPN